MLALLARGETDRAIARTLPVNRRTVARYRRWAESHGLLNGTLPDREEIARLATNTLPGRRPPQQVSTLEPLRAEILEYLRRGLSKATIRSRLEQTLGRPITYSALWRMVRRLEADASPHATAAATRGRTRRSRGGRPDSSLQDASAVEPASSSGVSPTQPGRLRREHADAGPLVPSRISNEELLAERRARLISTATDLFYEHGFHRTSVRDIAAAAGWQIGTLYLYVSSKEEILFLLLTAFHQAFADELGRVERQPSAGASLRALADCYFRLAARLHRELRILWREQSSLSPEHLAAGAASVRQQHAMFADLLRWGIEAGEFRPVNPDLFSHTIIMLARQWSLMTVFIAGDVPFEEFLEQQMNLVMHYLEWSPSDPELTLPNVAGNHTASLIGNL